MKPSFFIFLFSMLLPVYADSIIEYELLEMYTYQIGSQENEFAIENFDFGDIIMGPASINFANNGYFAIYDKWNESIKIFDSCSWEISEQITVELPQYNSSFDYIGILYTGDWLFLSSRNNSFVGISNREHFEIDLDDYAGLNKDHFLYLNNIVLFTDDRGFLYGLFLNNSNDFRILSHRETEQILEEQSFWEINDLQIEDRIYILDKNRLVTRDYRTFFRYWNSYYGDEFQTMEEHNWTGIPSLRAADDIDHLGTDNSGNNYWYFGNSAIFVTNSFGILVDIFQVQDNGSVLTWPTIHPNGDIIFLGLKDEAYHIYSVRNIWSTDENFSDDSTSTASVTADGLRLRDDPTVANSTVIGSLNYGSIVAILNRSEAQEIINGKSAFWYYIRTENGIEGWVFGAFLEL